MFQSRKAAFKAPALEDTQNYRRQKALEEQKRRRAQRVDATRQLEILADLSLGQSDEEHEQEEDVAIVRTGLAAYASMLPPAAPDAIPEAIVAPATATAGSKKKKKKWKPKAKRETAATASKWADQCMYAELLEMSEDNAWNEAADGLPEDLETGWVAVAPVPVGKRCLAVTDQSLGVPGVVPNTCLRSRKLGKLLLPRFPSTLPPLTVLDCILDANWRENGILHILDVHRWKGQDIGDCETPFRFWWRDTRIAELPLSPPPASSAKPSSASNPDSPMVASTSISLQYRFPYPTRFLPIPYCAETALPVLVERIIPLARSTRTIEVQVPSSTLEQSGESHEMAIDQSTGAPSLTTLTTEIHPDGLLLYVSEASYEPGTSPLSSWIPLVEYEGTYAGHDADGDGVMADSSPARTDAVPTSGPLDVFLRLVQRRLARRNGHSLGMDVV
ncbi:hypothetical protein HMN09_00333500 [Mycena chlorophos]|uniref:Snurportin-1 n=1 Tax=Mycena chlorophos TaxID=658473 RepID=A0A8H6TM86_MYCCL|nr:hypothetical protein HMN09_00333500 [Mycena chlorophos]